MPTPVELPKLGNTVEECLISKWCKQKGDRVASGDVVVEVETDKATFEVTAPVNGTLLERFFEEGALVPVFTNLFVLGEQGESAEAFRPGSSAPPAPETAAAPSAASPTLDSPTPAPTAAPVAAASTAAFSPRARRFQQEHDFHPQSVTGSGPGGRVLAEDLRKLYYATPQEPVAEPIPVAAPATAARISHMRERIAKRMRESLASSAQYTLNSSADAGGLLTLRARIKASVGVPDININDLVTFCTIQALLKQPELNAEFIEGKLHKYSDINIGFAVDTNRGLMVPVIRSAQLLPIGELATRMKTLTAQAVKGNISPDDLAGGTFTVSNLGGLGIESFTPLIYPPQVAILGVGAIQMKPVRKQGKVEFIDAIGFSLTCDHQIIDGAPGARFLQTLKEIIENVERTCTI